MAQYSVAQMLAMAKTAGFSGPGQIEIVAHALVESSGNSDAFNQSSGASGILQFLPSTAASVGLDNPFDAQSSFNAAYRLSHNGTNFADWTPYEPAAEYSSAYQKVQKESGQQRGQPSSPNPSGAGTGLLSGHQTDPWGISQGIADSVGNIGSTLGAIGRDIQNSGQVMAGLLIASLGIGVLVWMFLQTDAGRKITSASKSVAKDAVLLAK